MQLEWREAFWSYWIVLAVFIGVSLGLTLMLISKMIMVFMGSNKILELKAIIWFCLILDGFTICSCLIVLGIVQLMDEQNSSLL